MPDPRPKPRTSVRPRRSPSPDELAADLDRGLAAIADIYVAKRLRELRSPSSEETR